MEYSVSDLLFLKDKAPDIFYKTLTRFTNSELRELCFRDEENQFCNNIDFWESLWRSKYIDKPPKLDLEGLRQAYEEDNLLHSLIEDIYNDDDLAYALQKNIRRFEWNLANKEDIFTDLEAFQNAEDNYVNQPFKKMSREEIKQILTLTIQQKKATGGRESINHKNLYYELALIETAIKKRNLDLLYYYFLTTNIILVNFFRNFSEEDDKIFIDSVLERMEPLNRLPFILNSNLRILYMLCQPRIISAFFASDRKDKEAQLFQMLDVSPHLSQLRKCPESRNVLVKELQAMGSEAYDLKKMLANRGTNFVHRILNSEDIEPLLVEVWNNDFIERVLIEWDVDRVAILRDLINDNNWDAFRRLIWPIISLSKREEFDQEKQEELFNFYQEFFEGRVERKESGISEIIGENYLELALLQLLKGEYLLEALKLTFSQEPNPINTFKWSDFPTVTDEQIQELYAYLEETNPEIVDQLAQKLIVST